MDKPAPENPTAPGMRSGPAPASVKEAVASIRLAISAGNDLAMICHRVEMVEKAHGFLAKVPRPDLDRALASVADFKRKLAKPDAWDEAEFRRRDADVGILRAATLGAEAAAARSPENGKRSPVEIY